MEVANTISNSRYLLGLNNGRICRLSGDDKIGGLDFANNF